jgi:hypothetical protein
MKKTANPSPEAYKKGSRAFIWFGALWIAMTLMFGAMFGHDQWVVAQISQRGRTVPAQILGVEGGDGGDSSAIVQYTFTLPSGQRRVDTVQAPPKKVEEALGVVHSPFGLGWGQRFPPATVRYVSGEPSLHRLQGFESSAGSPLGAAVGLGLFVCFGGVFLGKGLQMRQEALAPAPSGGSTSPPGLTKPLAESGSLPGLTPRSGVVHLASGFTYRQEGQCFVLTPVRPPVSQVLMAVMVVTLVAGMFGVVAYLGATVIQGSWLAWHGIDVSGVTINGGRPSQAGIPALISGAVFGAGLFLFGFVPAAAAVWVTGEALCFGTRPSVLDRGRGEFRVGPRVVCRLGDIARLHLRRGHNPDAPENLPDARYYASFVLRNGRQVPLGLSARTSSFRKLQETEMGDGVAGAQIEAVMQAAAAFLGVEYALTGGPDVRLKHSGAE